MKVSESFSKLSMKLRIFLPSIEINLFLNSAGNTFKCEKETLQRTIADVKQKLFDMEMLLSQKSNRIAELMQSQEEVNKAKNQEIKTLKDEVQSKSTTINNQCEKMLKLQRLLAVREVLLHTLKKDKN